jgi:large subunit ribosomal protein L2
MINYFDNKPIKKLIVMLRRSDGRNNKGRITSYHRGGGVRKKFRLLDFSRSVLEIPGFIRRFEYDPNRNVPIALVCYANGILSYVLATQGAVAGSTFLNSKKYYNDFTLGTSLLLKNFPIGSFVHTIALQEFSSAKISRSAGAYAQILKKVGNDFIILKLKSGEHRLVSSNAMATSGVVANAFYKNISLRKAGQSRLLGRRPIVRGVAMNPIDHPHGGNTSGGMPSVSPWGKLAKAGKTRFRRKTTNKYILRSRLHTI